MGIPNDGGEWEDRMMENRKTMVEWGDRMMEKSGKTECWRRMGRQNDGKWGDRMVENGKQERAGSGVRFSGFQY